VTAAASGGGRAARGDGVRADLLAGLTVALVGLPQCLAYALMSGLPPAYGLSTAVVAGGVAALAGRSAQVVTGPTNTTGLLVLAALGPFLAVNGLLGQEGLPALATLTLLAGGLRIAAALAGGAHLVRFLPHSVLVGFTAGAGVLIGVMQLDEALGLSGVRGATLFTQALGIEGAIAGVRLPAVAVALGTALVIAAGVRWAPRWPVALLAVVGAAVAAWALGLGEVHGLPVVAERSPVPAGWPPGALPDLSLPLVHDLLGPASAIALLGTLELTVTASAGGARPDLRRELLAQGAANVAGAFAASFPASASLTRSALLRLGGARTRVAALAGAAFTLPILLWGSRFVGFVPQASLAGVLLVTALRMIDAAAMGRLWRASLESRLLLAVSFVSTLVLPLEWAILVGTGTGLVIHLARTSAPRVRLLRPEGARLVPLAAGEPAERVVVEVSGNLHYAAVPPFLDVVERLVPERARLVVLDLSHAHEVRYAAVIALERLAEERRRAGGRLVLAGVREDLSALLRRASSPLAVHPEEPEPGSSVRSALAEVPRAGADADAGPRPASPTASPAPAGRASAG
jgi:SulP family sulfate permease